MAGSGARAELNEMMESISGVLVGVSVSISRSGRRCGGVVAIAELRRQICLAREPHSILPFAVAMLAAAGALGASLVPRSRPHLQYEDLLLQLATPVNASHSGSLACHDS